jgi:hypothetical protein
MFGAKYFYQLGANLHWGKSDRYLYTNDVLDGKFAVCVKLGQKYDIARYWGPSKLDAHPVWSRDYKKVCFNGAPEGKRQVFIANLEGVI